MMFYNVFGDSVATTKNLLKAISQYTVSLATYNSKYDKVMRHEKDVFFSSQEKNGYELFKRNCGTCHNEPMLTNDSLQIMVCLWTPTIKIMEELQLLKILKIVLILECQP